VESKFFSTTPEANETESTTTKGNNPRKAVGSGAPRAGNFNEGTAEQRKMLKDLNKVISRSYQAAADLYVRWKDDKLTQDEARMYGSFKPNTAIYNTYLRAKSHLSGDMVPLLEDVLDAKRSGIFISAKTVSIMIGCGVRTNQIARVLSSDLIDKENKPLVFEYFLRGLSTCLYHNKLRQGLELFQKHHPRDILHSATPEKQDQYHRLKNDFVALTLHKEAWGLLVKVVKCIEKDERPLDLNTVAHFVSKSAYYGHFLLNNAMEMLWRYEREGKDLQLDYGTAYYLIANSSGNRSIHKASRKKIVKWVWDKVQPIDERVPPPIFYAILSFHGQEKNTSKCFDILASFDQLHPGKFDPYQMQILSSLLSGLDLQTPFNNPERFSKCVETLDEVFEVLLKRQEEEGKPITVSCINMLIAACGKAKELGRAFETFETFAEFGAEPNIYSYTLLMDICLQNRRYDAVFKMLEELEDRGIKMKSKTCEILLIAAMRRRDVYLVNDFLKLYQREGLNMTAYLVSQVEDFLAKYEQKTDEEKHEIDEINETLDDYFGKEEESTTQQKN
jgi:pentatricopeptide repeat protein